MASTELFIFAFQEEASAGVALAELQEWKKDGITDIVDAAVLVRDKQGRIHVKESADPEPGKGALIGAFAGALVGLLAGPAGAVVGAATGAGAGGFAAHKIDLGIPNERLEEIAQELQPGTLAIIALIERTSADQAVARLEQYGAKAVRQTVKEESAIDLRTQAASQER
jgi:uncharacterized membrane protein